MRETTGTDVLAMAVVLAALSPNPAALTALSALIFVGTPLYVATMIRRAWLFHRRGIARVRAYETKLAR